MTMLAQAMAEYSGLTARSQTSGMNDLLAVFRGGDTADLLLIGAVVLVAMYILTKLLDAA